MVFTLQASAGTLLRRSPQQLLYLSVIERTFSWREVTLRKPHRHHSHLQRVVLVGRFQPHRFSEPDRQLAPRRLGDTGRRRACRIDGQRIRFAYRRTRRAYTLSAKETPQPSLLCPLTSFGGRPFPSNGSPLSLCLILSIWGKKRQGGQKIEKHVPYDSA